MKLSLALQHWQCGVCCGAGSAVVPPKTATSSSMPPCTPKSLGGGTDGGLWVFPTPKGCGNGNGPPIHTLLPCCSWQRRTLGNGEMLTKKRECKKGELKIPHSALAVRAKESVLAGKGGTGSEFGQGCGGQGRWLCCGGVGFSPCLCSFPELRGQGRDLFCSQESP